MPTVTVQGAVTLQEAAKALQDRLGSRYEVTTLGSDAQEALKVKQSAASTATVHLDQDGNATTFHVHGGGLVISRMVNEFGIAKKVAATIEEAFATRPPADVWEEDRHARRRHPAPAEGSRAPE
jgi:hypothetical protein